MPIDGEVGNAYTRRDMNAVSTAIDRAGGVSALARTLGISPPTVSQWRAGARPVPPDRCPDIEHATGVPCEELRPDLEWVQLPDGRKIDAGPRKAAA